MNLALKGLQRVKTWCRCSRRVNYALNHSATLQTTYNYLTLLDALAIIVIYHLDALTIIVLYNLDVLRIIVIYHLNEPTIFVYSKLDTLAIIVLHHLDVLTIIFI